MGLSRKMACELGREALLSRISRGTKSLRGFLTVNGSATLRRLKLLASPSRL